MARGLARRMPCAINSLRGICLSRQMGYPSMVYSVYVYNTYLRETEIDKKKFASQSTTDQTASIYKCIYTHSPYRALLRKRSVCNLIIHASRILLLAFFEILGSFIVCVVYMYI